MQCSRLHWDDVPLRLVRALDSLGAENGRQWWRKKTTKKASRLCISRHISIKSTRFRSLFNRLSGITFLNSCGSVNRQIRVAEEWPRTVCLKPSSFEAHFEVEGRVFGVQMVQLANLMCSAISRHRSYFAHLCRSPWM